MNETGTQSPGPAHPDSRVRDHLANERTFLAWIRTSLGLIGVGFVLARMGLLLQQLALGMGSVPHPEIRGSRQFTITGILFLALGTIIGAGSGWRYQRSRISIDAGRYEPARHTITALTVIVTLGSLIIAGLLLRQLTSPVEK